MPNYGLGLLPSIPLFGGDFSVKYHSRDYPFDPDLHPLLEIRCGGASPTPTPTPTRTPTPTPTPTPTTSPTPVPDTANVEAYHLEITQGVQDGAHSILLVEGKRTYVRLYYDLHDPVPDVLYRTTAKLNIYRGGVFQESILPINGAAGYLDLVDNTWFLIPEHTFIFELPYEYITGEIRLMGVIDPEGELPESTWADNFVERTVSFEPVLAKDFHFYQITHIDGQGNSTTVNQTQIYPSWQYTKATMPMGPATVYYHYITYDERELDPLRCERMNWYLLYYLAGMSGFDPDTYYYAFMPGGGTGISCAAGIPHSIASSWIGSSESTMAHELGHCFGRHHTAHPSYDGDSGIDFGCGAKTGCFYAGGILWGCPDGFDEYPYVEGTVRVDLEGPQGGLKRITSGAALPRVTLLSPNGGEVLAGRTITVTWTASDIDDDTLTFNVQYSTDDGATWQMVAVEVSSDSVVLDSANLPGSEQGRFRVLASDGIHTRSDVSDAAFTVPNHRPSIQILTPEEGAVYIVSQTVALQAWVSDVEEGSMAPERVSWQSSLDGFLGNGGDLSTAGLSAGLHTLYAIAEDSEGASDVAVVHIEVYAGPGDLPPQPDLLAASPTLLSLNPHLGAGSRPIYLYNANNPEPLSWTASASEPWVHLSATSGSTPEVISVWASTFGLPEGYYTATVTFTNDAAPTESATVELAVTATRFYVYLPLTVR
ncbi:MAG: hypothetical protein JXA37_01635 [Chloroflexia bacterium]|nr:hypothetical protein [Chloroflexia bacterium]